MLYQLGSFARWRRAGHAAKAFEESASTPWALTPYARLQAAQWYVGVNQYDAAIAQASAAASYPPIAGAVDLVLADALAGKNDLEGAIARWRSYLARDKHPAQWSRSRFGSRARCFSARARRTRGSDSRGERVEFESPGGAGAGNAKDISKQALATLAIDRRKAFEHPTSDEQLARAKNLVASQQHKEAIALVAKILKLPRWRRRRASSRAKRGSRRPRR